MTQEAVAPPVLRDANQFDIAGPIAVSFATTSFAGKPTFAYRDAQLDLSFSGPEITRTPSPVGELVTVVLEQVPDAFIRSFTLVVPTVRVREIGPDGSAEFATFGFETVQLSTLVPTAGVQQQYRIHELCGTAQALDF